MKVLIVKLSSMGDVIGTLPALTDARNAIPDISFDWALEENFIEIPHWHQAVDAVIPMALRRWRKTLWNPNTIKEIHEFWKNLRTKKYDYVIDAHGLLKSATVAMMAHGKRHGFSFNNVREPLASFFYNKKFDVKKDLHVTERLRKLFSLTLNYETTSDALNYGILDYFVTKSVPRNDSLPDEKYLVFVHGASRNNKCWSEGKWMELANLAKTLGLKVKLPWGNNTELARAKNIAQATINVEVLPKMSITEIAGVILNAKGVIAVDTGFGHLAAALEIPTLSMYGPTNPKSGGAYGKNQTYLTDMKGLSPEMVWQKLSSSFAI